MDGSILTGPLYVIIFMWTNGITCIYNVDFEKKMVSCMFLDYFES